MDRDDNVEVSCARVATMDEGLRMMAVPCSWVMDASVFENSSRIRILQANPPLTPTYTYHC